MFISNEEKKFLFDSIRDLEKAMFVVTDSIYNLDRQLEEISKKKTRKPWTPESRQRMSEAMKASHARRKAKKGETA